MFFNGLDGCGYTVKGCTYTDRELVEGGTDMAYDEIEKVKCNVCGTETSHSFTIEVWNDLGECPGCEPTNDVDSLWFFVDGTMTHIRHLVSRGGEEQRFEGFDMNRLSDLIKERGVPAFCDHSGGGNATIYVGESFTDENGDTRWPLRAGAGRYFLSSGIAMGDWAEFSYGTDDDYRAETVEVTRRPLTQLADEIVAFYNSLKVGA